MILLVPADALRPARPDAHFAPEAEAARAAGLDVAVVDHDALTSPGPATAAVRRVPAGSGTAVYRGWMLRSEQYAGFARALAGRGVRLLTTPEQYRRAHELPGWYPALTKFTPKSVWTDGTDRAAFDAARAALGFGPAVLRDHVKSAKHHWHEATYIPDLADSDRAWAVAERFLELREDDLVGGFVLRRFEAFTGAEARTWWVGGRCRLVTAHPDTPDESPPADVDLEPLAPVVAGLGLPFVTVDLTRRTDGAWRVVELGDGQVSDRPVSTDPAALVAALVSGAEHAG